MTRTNRDRFWDHLCAYSNAVYGLFVVGVALLSLTVFSLVNLDVIPRAGQIVVFVNLVLITGLLVCSGYVLYRCRR